MAVFYWFEDIYSHVSFECLQYTLIKHACKCKLTCHACTLLLTVHLSLIS